MIYHRHCPSVEWGCWGKQASETKNADCQNKLRLVDGSLLVIYSEPLVKILHDVVVFYPGLNLNLNPLMIRRPFSLLFHTLPALRKSRVILESRSFKDIKINGMVSGQFHSKAHSKIRPDNNAAFLRMLKYFNSVILMTTKRLGTMDHAF